MTEHKRSKPEVPPFLTTRNLADLRQGKVVEPLLFLEPHHVLAPLKNKPGYRIQCITQCGLDAQIITEDDKFISNQFRVIEPLRAFDSHVPGNYYQVLLGKSGGVYHLLIWDNQDKKYKARYETFHRVNLYPELGYRLVAQRGDEQYLLNGETGAVVFNISEFKTHHFEFDGRFLSLLDQQNTLLHTIEAEKVPPVKPLRV